MTATFGLHETERRELELIYEERTRLAETLDKLEIRIMSYDPDSDDPNERNEWHDLDSRIKHLSSQLDRIRKREWEQEDIVAALDAQWGAP